MSRRVSTLASVYRPISALMGTFGSGMLSRIILVSGNGSAASIRSRVAGVATFPCTVTPDSSRYPSKLVKNRTRFCRIGPPSDPPNWLNLIAGLAVVGGRNGSRDANLSLWKFSNSDPWNWLVPERVIMFT